MCVNKIGLHIQLAALLTECWLSSVENARYKVNNTVLPRSVLVKQHLRSSLSRLVSGSSVAYNNPLVYNTPCRRL